MNKKISEFKLISIQVLELVVYYSRFNLVYLFELREFLKRLEEIFEECKNNFIHINKT